MLVPMRVNRIERILQQHAQGPSLAHCTPTSRRHSTSANGMTNRSDLPAPPQMHIYDNVYLYHNIYNIYIYILIYINNICKNKSVYSIRILYHI